MAKPIRKRKARANHILRLEHLETRRLFAADLVSQDWIAAHGLEDLSGLVAEAGGNVEVIQAAIEEHNNHHHGEKHPAFEPLDSRGELPFGPIRTIDVGLALNRAGQDLEAAATGSSFSTMSTGLNVPVLNSLPGAAASIYLDFNGHFEATWGQYTNVTSPPFDLDGDTSSFNSDEITYMQTVWAIVAEDFSPFNINVTTVEPPTLAPGMAPSAANGKALRVAIGGGVDILGLDPGVIGYAYYNSFTSSVSNAAYVLPVRSGGSIAAAITIGSVASHEAGHSFGLRHQASGFDMDQRTQSIMLGMSLGYDQAYWAYGANDQGTIQDDMAMIANATNGFGYRPDDHSNTTTNASILTVEGSDFVGTGIIGQNTDADVWLLPSASGAYRAVVQGFEVGQNLDAVVELLDADGNLLKTHTPSYSNDAELSVELQGEQYLRIRSSGAYGRVGQYNLRLSPATAGFDLVAPNTLIVNESGQNDRFSFSLTSPPVANVTIDATVLGNASVVLSTTSLTFTPENWSIPQTVVVSGVDNGTEVAASSFAIELRSFSLDPVYNDMAIPTLTGICADQQFAGWTSGFATTQSNSTVSVTQIETLSNGDLVIAGYYAGAVDFDFGPSETVLSGTSTNEFVARYDSAGSLRWATPILSGTNSITINDIASDSGDHIYLGGSFSGTNVTIGSTILTNKGSSDAFVAKISSSGEVLWAKSWGGTEGDILNGIAVAPTGEVVMIGSFNVTVDFDPGTAVVSRVSVGGADSFLLRLSSEGNFQNVATFGGVNQDYLRQIAVDGAGNTYISGYFATATNIGGQNLVSSGSADGVLFKLNSQGQVVWLRQVFSESASGLSQKLARSSDGRIYLAIPSSSDVHFGPDTPTLSFNGNSIVGIALTAWDENGNYLAGGTQQGEATLNLMDLSIDNEGGLLVTGRMRSKADLDPQASTNEFDPVAPQADFVARINSQIQLTDAIVIPSTGSSVGSQQRARSDRDGNLFITGPLYGSTTSFAPTGDIVTNSTSTLMSYVTHIKVNPGVTVTPLSTLTTTESGGTASVAISLNIRPTSDVLVSLSTSDSTEGTVSPNVLTFTPENWRVPQSVVITGVDDSVMDGNQNYSITPTLTSSDERYNLIAVAPIAVINQDDDQPRTLFEDSFEVGEWNGRWVEDSQNDWFRSTQRATKGSYSAEVDGSASNATLTTANGIDLTGLDSATLTFDWLIESGFDSGEFLSLDVSTNGGATWIQDVRRLNGNVSAENVWRSETVDMSPYMTANTKIRFRSTVSASDEDANVDNVLITGVVAGPNTAPIANAGSGYTMNEGGSVTLSGAASSDPDGSIATYAWDLDLDGQYDDATGVSPTFSTTNSGTFTVGLLVTDNRGATSTATTTVVVNNVAPTANAGNDLTGLVNQSIQLNASGSSDPGNDIVSYLWDLNNDGVFGDAAGSQVAFSSAIAGGFAVGLRVIDADGAVGHDSLTITISAAPVLSTKFYVVDDAGSDRTFEYTANGTSVENYSLGSDNTAPRGAASTVAGDKVWVVDANKMVYIYNAAGALLGSWSAGSLASNATIEGITTNGADVWLVDARQDRVYRYTGAASRLSGSQNAASSFALNSGNRDPKDLVTDGSHIWVVNSTTTDRVFKYTVTGSLVGNWTIDSANSSPTGITLDPSGASQSLWIVDNGTDRVYEYTNARGRNSGSQSAANSFALGAGNSNPQGIADPPVASVNQQAVSAPMVIGAWSTQSEQRPVNTNSRYAAVDRAMASGLLDYSSFPAGQASAGRGSTAPTAAEQRVWSEYTSDLEQDEWDDALSQAIDELVVSVG